MSTAIGHGLAEPKRRGKPVSNANKGRRVLWLECVKQRVSKECKAYATPGSKGNPVNIPEPEGWTGRFCLELWICAFVCGWVKLSACGGVDMRSEE